MWDKSCLSSAACLEKFDIVFIISIVASPYVIFVTIALTNIIIITVGICL